MIRIAQHRKRLLESMINDEGRDSEHSEMATELYVSIEKLRESHQTVLREIELFESAVLEKERVK